MDTQQLWQAVLGELELSLSKAHFVTWFKNTFISEYANNQIVIGVPNNFTKNWLEKKHHDRIIELLKRLTANPRIQIFYKIESNKNFLKKQLLSIVQQDIQELTENVSFPGSQAIINNKTGLNPKYQFENFIVGKGNELAHAAARAVVSAPGKTYNPLFVHGGVGLGKTHLMQAVGNDIFKAFPNLKVIYITSETFTNQYIQSIKEGRTNEFKDKYRSLDVLLVDDIQFISGKEGTQDAFFHTFNELHQNNKQIIISSDRPPKAIYDLESRLSSRFEWGMIADIVNPDFETRVAILEAKCRERHYTIEMEIVKFIANTIHNNVRELEGALNKIVAYHHLNNTTPTMESVKSILSTITANLQRQAITPKFILETISKFFDINTADIIGTSREKRLVIPRQIGMYLMREELKTSFPAIGQEIGGRDHTTAMHAYDKIKREIKRDEQIRQNVVLLKQKIYA